jgi:hypothetical protein
VMISIPRTRGVGASQYQGGVGGRGEYGVSGRAILAALIVGPADLTTTAGLARGRPHVQSPELAPVHYVPLHLQPWYRQRFGYDVWLLVLLADKRYNMARVSFLMASWIMSSVLFLVATWSRRVEHGSLRAGTDSAQTSILLQAMQGHSLSTR